MDHSLVNAVTAPGPQQSGLTTSRVRGGGMPRPGDAGPCQLAASHPDAPCKDVPVHRASWENEAVARLGELLTADAIEALLGPLFQSVSWDRQAETLPATRQRARTGPGPCPVARDRVVPRCRHPPGRGESSRVTVPSRSRPGKPSAVQFVRDARFPDELAGADDDGSSPDLKYLEGRSRLPGLLPFQDEVRA